MTKKQLEIEFLNDSRFKEIWVEAENGACMCALINGDLGWLMYLREKGDAGYSSRNPNVKSDEEMEFILSNGQADLYPKNWTYHVSILREAMSSLLETGDLPKLIEWHNDAEQNT